MNTNTTPQTKWSTYRTNRYINLIVRLYGGDIIGAELTHGHLGNKTEAQLRGIIESVTGKKFVYGFNPHDASMVAGNENTYGWFIPVEDNA